MAFSVVGLCGIVLVLAIVVGLAALGLRASRQRSGRRTVLLLIAATLLVALVALAITAGVAWQARARKLDRVEVVLQGTPSSLAWEEVLEEPALLDASRGELEAGSIGGGREQRTLRVDEWLDIELFDGHGTPMIEVKYGLRLSLQLDESEQITWLHASTSRAAGGHLDWRCAMQLEVEAGDVLRVTLYVGPPSGALQMTQLRYRVSADGLQRLQP